VSVPDSIAKMLGIIVAVWAVWNVVLIILK
jgi:hypothetical protein